MDTVYLHSSTPEKLCLCVTDRIIYPAHPDFILTFHRPSSVEGSLELSDVRLRIREIDSIASGMNEGGCKTLFEFVSEETVPTEGRPIQHEMLASGESRVLFGRVVEHSMLRIIAAALDIAPQTPAEPDA